ncbi:helix-turn-helix domain-containing protein [Rhizobium sp. CF080]|uniref:helix-turn-helix domain-containing protein n=1 Tax=Rhizobium sp. (strain CF080) TaxID=1144310 RepID=UPI0012DBD4B2|nr:helix-turn-helix domain-containing protein [Rhizobium sp. CF080]
MTKTKRAVHIMLRDGGNGFQEQIMSVSAALQPRERRIEAKKLRKEGMSQTAIAARLGVSQKTISNDLDGR